MRAQSVKESLQAELDALFQLAPAEMVEARNALAARLRKSGERDAAEQIKRLKRPAPAAWAINQVYFHARELLERAMAQVADVRALQATDGVDRQQLAAAGAEQRAAIQAIVDAAVRFGADAGLPTGPLQERKVFTTVQAWLGGTGDEPPGRMTRELEPSGFEAIGALGSVAPLPAASSNPTMPPISSARPVVVPTRPPLPAPKPITQPTPPPPSAEELARRERERAQARVLEHKQALEWAQTRVAEQRKKLGMAEHEVERARLEVADAQRMLANRSARLADREAELARKRAEVEDADRIQRDAEDALAQARAAFAKL